MRPNSRPASFYRLTAGPILLLFWTTDSLQSSAYIEGQVTDQNGAVVLTTEITAVSRAISVGHWFSSRADSKRLTRRNQKREEKLSLCPPSAETVSQTVGNMKWKEQES